MKYGEIDETLSLREVFENSKMLSSDVNAAYDPLYSDVMDKRNSSYYSPNVTFYLLIHFVIHYLIQLIPLSIVNI